MPVPSATSWSVVVVGVSSPGTAEQVTAHVVPEGMEIGVTARLTNTQLMFLGPSQTAAQTPGSRKELQPGQSTSLRVWNTNLIWVDAENSSDRLELVPQKLPSTGG